MEAFDLDLMPLMDEFEQELEGKSDRSLVIVAAAGFEVLLEKLLSANLILPKDRSILFGNQGPLAEFSAKIKMAHALGLISNDEKDDIERIRKIRNMMAHQLGVTFSSDAVRGQCQNLKLGERLYVPPVIPAAGLGRGKKGFPSDLDHPAIIFPTVEVTLPNAHEPRARFVATARSLIRCLGARQSLSDGPPASPSEFEFPEGPVEAILDATEVYREKVLKLWDRIDEIRRTRGADAIPKDLDTSIVNDEAMKTITAYVQVGRYANEVIRRSRAAQAEGSEDNE